MIKYFVYSLLITKMIIATRIVVAAAVKVSPRLKGLSKLEVTPAGGGMLGRLLRRSDMLMPCGVDIVMVTASKLAKQFED